MKRLTLTLSIFIFLLMLELAVFPKITTAAETVMGTVTAVYGSEDDALIIGRNISYGSKPIAFARIQDLRLVAPLSKFEIQGLVCKVFVGQGLTGWIDESDCNALKAVRVQDGEPP
jgi:hypothetical protein